MNPLLTAVHGRHSEERRRNRQRTGKIAGNPQPREFVREQVRWSPGQISNRLRTDFPGQPGMRVVPETVN
jgi:IS30 family transposase